MVNRFELNPTSLDISRSRFPRNFSHKTTFDTGRLIPVYVEEVLPGDTLQLNCALMIRQLGLATPVLDNAYLDVNFYFVPNRLVWEHFKQFMGENDTSAWTQTTEYLVPSVAVAPISKGSVGDYMGLPLLENNSVPISALPYRAYCKIWNDWYRDQNYQSPILFSVGDDGSDADYDSAPDVVNKFHDYFTSVLPQAQKGDAVTIGVAGEAALKSTNDPSFAFLDAHAGQYTNFTQTPLFKVSGQTSRESIYNLSGVQIGSVSGQLAPGVDTNHSQGTSQSWGVIQGSNLGVNLENLYADLSTATAVSINQLRYAFQLQRFLEKDSRSGSRYQETVRAHFGVVGPDASLQISEYLGGKRIPINVDAVVANATTGSAGTADTSYIGELAGYSKTGDRFHCVSKSFTEHGWVIGVACVRTLHSYSQGFDRKWLRRTRYDYYWPVFANIGEQAVLSREINAFSTQAQADPEIGLSPTSNTAIFGYQEAWAEYRFSRNMITGKLRPGFGLDNWTYTDNFGTDFYVASGKFMEESADNVQRTLLVEEADMQWLADFYFMANWIRPMPVNSIPGLIDHH